MPTVTGCLQAAEEGTYPHSKCMVEIVLIINSLICLVFLFFLLALEFIQKKYKCSSLVNIKSLIFEFCSLELIDTACHYLFYNNEIVITYSLMFIESMRFLCFFLVCYYFCKKSSHVLPPI